MSYSRCLSAQHFFSLYSDRYSPFFSLLSLIRHMIFPGKIVRLHFSFEVVPFFFSTYLKAEGFKHFQAFFVLYSYEGVCVSLKARLTASSITLRFVDAGVLCERKTFFFSPTLIGFSFPSVKHSGQKHKKFFKSKLYCFQASSQKKLVSFLFL